MLARLMTWLDGAERRLRQSFGRDMVTRRGRMVAWTHFLLMDHHLLRLPWTNLYQIAPGIWRSNQPGPGRLKRYRDMGIRTVITLRGVENYPHYHFEREACEALGLTFVACKLRARDLLPAEAFLDVIETLRGAERPLVFHCKSGADRAGMVAAIYLIVFEGQPVEVALRQLGIRYMHLSFSKTGVQGYMLRAYAARNARAPIGFEDWLRTEYDHRALQAAFDAGRPPAEAA